MLVVRFSCAANLKKTKQNILGLSLTCSPYSKFSSRHKGSCLQQILSVPVFVSHGRLKGTKVEFYGMPNDNDRILCIKSRLVHIN